MRLESKTKIGDGTVDRIIYDDIYGASEFFEPKIWIDTWSKDKFWLKTAAGEKISVSKLELKQLNFKIITRNVGTRSNRLYKHFMTVNSPRKASERIPLLSIARKLNKVWKRSINVEEQYRRRYQYGFRFWNPEK